MIHKAKKSLGQNFLKSQSALRAMITAGDVNKNDTILEIGPGKGALTEKLLEQGAKVIAIEKDKDLVLFLQEKFTKELKNKKLVLIEEDILNIDITTHPLLSDKYKLIANIPYNITGAIFKKFLSSDNHPNTMVLLVQKEVAERIVARNNKNGGTDGKESILSISVKAYGKAVYITKVSKKYFSPSPKVDSAIIQITDISKRNFKNYKQEELFFKIVKSGFAHKRKVLVKNLESIISKEKILKIFEDLNIPKNIRAERVSLDKWLDFVQKITSID